MARAPILLVGAGRLGGALLAGCRAARLVTPAQLLIRDPTPGDEALAAARDGARLNPSRAEITEAGTVVLAMKPQSWRSAAAELAPRLRPDAIVVSLLAGVGLEAIADAFRGRPAARAMPTMAISVRKGPISLFTADPLARAGARWLLSPLGELIEFADEGLMDAATAASGSGPAYLYAFVESLASAGTAAGLPAGAADRLARATVIGAAHLMDASGARPEDLRRQVASPGGTTEAGLRALASGIGLAGLMGEAVAAATARARELGGQ